MKIQEAIESKKPFKRIGTYKDHWYVNANGVLKWYYTLRPDSKYELFLSVLDILADDWETMEGV